MFAAIQSLVRKQEISARRVLLPIVATVAGLQIVLQIASETVAPVNAVLVYALLTLLLAVDFGMRIGQRELVGRC